MLINNKLWKFKLRQNNITLNARDKTYLLGNCFTLINYIFDLIIKISLIMRFYINLHEESILSRYIELTGFKKIIF